MFTRLKTGFCFVIDFVAEVLLDGDVESPEAVWCQLIPCIQISPHSQLGGTQYFLINTTCYFITFWSLYVSHLLLHAHKSSYKCEDLLQMSKIKEMHSVAFFESSKLTPNTITVMKFICVTVHSSYYNTLNFQFF